MGNLIERRTELELIYATEKVKAQCTSVKTAKKLFDGSALLTNSLMARIFAIDVKSRPDKWRIILQPLNENRLPFDPCNIDEIADNVRIVEITEVSSHYE